MFEKKKGDQLFFYFSFPKFLNRVKTTRHSSHSSHSSHAPFCSACTQTVVANITCPTSPHLWACFLLQKTHKPAVIIYRPGFAIRGEICPINHKKTSTKKEREMSRLKACLDFTVECYASSSCLLPTFFVLNFTLYSLSMNSGP